MLQVIVLIIHWHCFQISYARAHLAKTNKFASKRTLDYFRKKYPENAKKLACVTDSSECRDGERHGSSCRMQYLTIIPRERVGYHIQQARVE